MRGDGGSGAVEEPARCGQDSLREGEDCERGRDGDDAVEGAEVWREIAVSLLRLEHEFCEALDGVWRVLCKVLGQGGAY